MLANWPLLLIRIAESVLMGLILVAGAVAVIIPVGFRAITSFRPTETDPGQLIDLLFEHPFLLTWIVLIVTAVTLVAVAVHAFLEAGAIGVYLEGWQGSVLRGDRRAFAQFTPDSWLASAREHWWTIFLIYNVVWAIFGLILLFPLMILAAIMFSMADPSTALLTGCMGAVLLLIVGVIGGMLFSLWSRFAVTEAVRGRGTVRESLLRGWRAILRRATDVVFVVAVAIGVTIVATFLFGAMYLLVGAISQKGTTAIMTFPVQIALSLGQNAFSVILSAWFAAAVAGVLLKSEGASVYSG